MDTFRDTFGTAAGIALLGFLLAAVPTSGQDRPGRSALEDPLVREVGKSGLDHLYNLDYEEALRSFEEIDARYPGHPIGPFLRGLTIWWKILLDMQDTSNDSEFFDAMEEVIRRSDRMLDRDERDADAMFFKGAALGFRGRLRSNRGEWFQAAMDGRGAMKYVLEIPKLDPDNADFVFGKGLYDYFAVVVPDRHPVVKPLMVFFPRGDRERGLQEITRTAEDGYFIQTEAVYFLFQIYYLYELDFDECVRHVSWLRQRYPRNGFFHGLEGRVYAKWGRWSTARAIFEDILERYVSGEEGYTPALAEVSLYNLARNAMNRREFEISLDYLMQLEALSARSEEDTFYRVMGRLRQGMVHDAMGRRNVAIARYREVLKMKDFSSAHERAERYLDKPYGG